MTNEEYQKLKAFLLKHHYYHDDIIKFLSKESYEEFKKRFLEEIANNPELLQENMNVDDKNSKYINTAIIYPYYNIKNMMGQNRNTPSKLDEIENLKWVLNNTMKELKFFDFPTLRNLTNDKENLTTEFSNLPDNIKIYLLSQAPEDILEDLFSEMISNNNINISKTYFKDDIFPLLNKKIFNEEDLMIKLLLLNIKSVEYMPDGFKNNLNFLRKLIKASKKSKNPDKIFQLLYLFPKINDYNELLEFLKQDILETDLDINNNFSLLQYSDLVHNQDFLKELATYSLNHIDKLEKVLKVVLSEEEFIKFNCNLLNTINKYNLLIQLKYFNFINIEYSFLFENKEYLETISNIENIDSSNIFKDIIIRRIKQKQNINIILPFLNKELFNDKNFMVMLLVNDIDNIKYMPDLFKNDLVFLRRLIAEVKMDSRESLIQDNFLYLFPKINDYNELLEFFRIDILATDLDINNNLSLLQYSDLVHNQDFLKDLATNSLNHIDKSKKIIDRLEKVLKVSLSEEEFLLFNCNLLNIISKNDLHKHLNFINDKYPSLFKNKQYIDIINSLDKDLFKRIILAKLNEKKNIADILPLMNKELFNDVDFMIKLLITDINNVYYMPDSFKNNPDFFKNLNILLNKKPELITYIIKKEPYKDMKKYLHLLKNINSNTLLELLKKDINNISLLEYSDLLHNQDFLKELPEIYGNNFSSYIQFLFIRLSDNEFIEFNCNLIESINKNDLSKFLDFVNDVYIRHIAYP